MKKFSEPWNKKYAADIINFNSQSKANLVVRILFGKITFLLYLEIRIILASLYGYENSTIDSGQ